MDAPGYWGKDRGAYVLTHLRRNDVYPIEERIQNYDEALLFTVMEFLYDHVSMKFDFLLVYHYSKKRGQKVYRKRLNEILIGYKDGYRMNEEGEIHSISPRGLEDLVNGEWKTADPENID